MIIDGILCGSDLPFHWVYYSPLEEDEGNQPRISRELLVKASGFIIMCLKVSSLVEKGFEMVCLQSGVSCPSHSSNQGQLV
jgi:hypothetical protein